MVPQQELCRCARDFARGLVQRIRKNGIRLLNGAVTEARTPSKRSRSEFTLLQHADDAGPLKRADQGRIDRAPDAAARPHASGQEGGGWDGEERTPPHEAFVWTWLPERQTGRSVAGKLSADRKPSSS